MTNASEEDDGLEDLSKKRIVVGFAGRKQSGKDTALQPFVDKGFTLVRFADPLKAMLRTFMLYTGMDEETVERCINGDMKEVELTIFGGRTTRYAMQTLGTEWGRCLVWDDLWVSALKTHVRKRRLRKVGIPDVRFPNEVEAIHDLRGKVIRANRKSSLPKEGAPRHDSEELVDKLKVDADIYNDGTVQQFQDKAVKKVKELWCDPEVKTVA